MTYISNSRQHFTEARKWHKQHNNMLPARTSHEVLWKRPEAHMSMPSTFHWLGFYSTSLANFWILVPKIVAFSFFIHVSRKNFLEGHTTTQAYTKINCLYRNLWVDVWVPGRTTVMYLRIHLELLTLNHSRAADFSVEDPVSK